MLSGASAEQPQVDYHVKEGISKGLYKFAYEALFASICATYSVFHKNHMKPPYYCSLIVYDDYLIIITISSSIDNPTSFLELCSDVLINNLSRRA